MARRNGSDAPWQPSGWKVPCAIPDVRKRDKITVPDPVSLAGFDLRITGFFVPSTLKGLTLSKIGPVRAVISSPFPFRRFHLRLFTVSRLAGGSTADRGSSVWK